MGKQTVDKVFREIVGIFFDSEHLHNTIDDLRNHGFSDDQVGLLASAHSVEQTLSDTYTRTTEPIGTDTPPTKVFIRKDSPNGTLRSFGSSLFFAGTTIGGGFAVASSAVLGGVLVPALVGAATVGATGVVVRSIIKDSDAQYLEEQVDQGHLVLLVRPTNREQEVKALKILSRHSGFDVRIHEIPVKKAGKA